MDSLPMAHISSKYYSVTDRRHGQQVIRGHNDIISKLVKLVITFSVELKELQQGKDIIIGE